MTAVQGMIYIHIMYIYNVYIMYINLKLNIYAVFNFLKLILIAEIPGGDRVPRCRHRADYTAF